MSNAGAGGSLPALFVSDLHLSPVRPEALQDFHAFLRGPARSAAALYVLGDLWDAWLGDDQLREPFAADVAAGLALVADGGTRIYLQQGNRDFLLGSRFAAASKSTLLPDIVVHELFGLPTLIMHGDLLCTDDVDYQRFRRWVHIPMLQRIFAALPYALKRLVAERLRAGSRGATAAKPPTIMDVSAAAVEQALRDSGAARLIHGHTHRPARHEHGVDGRRIERWVLGDWYDRGSYLEVTAAGVQPHALAVH